MDRDEGGGQTAKGGEEEPGRAVSAELVVYDKHSRCLLTEGEYELVLGDTADTATKISPNKEELQLGDHRRGDGEHVQSATCYFRKKR